MITDYLEFSCPWCGEANQVECEPDDAGQWLTQDCAVCCRPIDIRLPDFEGSELRIGREGGD
ncbi:MAG: CPXCG motif-containing cysteine-rich protein [Wenzhouxiangellaceae bacterium]|nr:CPXCG motif-containing cysteine-rich protein [Wenzhouxiangellaceae bacterium]